MKMEVEIPPYNPYLSYPLTERTMLRPKRGPHLYPGKAEELGFVSHRGALGYWMSSSYWEEMGFPKGRRWDTGILKSVERGRRLREGAAMVFSFFLF